LQTLANGHPIAPFDVGRELGHGGDAMVRRVYGHVGQVKHRSELVEYRIEQHEPHLRERLATLKDRSAAQADNSAATESTANEDTQQSESTAQGNPSVDDYGAAC
jgi:hypothetical protein